MTKGEFLNRLDQGLAQLPAADRGRYVESYAELIEDKMEDGMDESAAVGSLQAPEEIVHEIFCATPASMPVLATVKAKGGKRAGSVILIVLGAPVWLPLLVALGAVVLSVWLVFWSVVVSLYAAVAAVAVGAAACLAAMFLAGSVGGILMCFGTALILAGLALVSGVGVTGLAKQLARLTVWACRCCKRRLIKRG